MRQSQIVQGVMQDFQYVLSHLLPECNLLAQGPKITSLRAGSLVWTGSLDRELARRMGPTLFLASPVLGTSEPARRQAEK